ncbi:MAG: SPASM domain-containing protein [Candidatus Gygaella obscura]|nr:SPASM domain-containing protein [Candidatus Gygaella obscura]
MQLEIRNKNRLFYEIRLKIKKIIYSNEYLLRKYSFLKSIVIKYFSCNQLKDNKLFEKVFIETISYCNNDCEFCSVRISSVIKKSSNLMEEGIFLKIIEELVNLSFKGSVAFHCNNEPFLDERLPYFIKLARKMLKKNFFYLYTNGTLLTDELLKDVFIVGINRIIVNDYNGSFKLMQTVENFVKHNRELNGEIIFYHRKTNEFLGNRSGASPNKRLILEKPLKAICIRPAKEIVICYDGSVMLCCCDSLWKNKMGNINESSLKDIWVGHDFASKRKALLRFNRNISSICKVCDAVDLSVKKGVLF